LIHATSRFRRSTAAILIALLSASAAHGQSHDTPAEAVEREVRENVRKQAVGNHSLEQFNLPPAFISRMADRIIRSSFEERYRIVVDDGSDGGEQATGAATAASAGSDAEHGGDAAVAPTRIGLYLTGAAVLVSGAATIVLLVRQRKARA
jgi:hypothetical protein